MSTVSEHYPLSARRTTGRLRSLAVNPRPRSRAAGRSGAGSVMGPANRAPGLPLMGAADAGLHPYLMGGPDADGYNR
jgi:hypothetical protein